MRDDLPVKQATTTRGASAGDTRFPCFDGLRAIAALSVFVAHAAGYLWFHESTTWAPQVVQAWLARLGLFGVAVFFVLSGFLLYRPYVAAHLGDRPVPRLVPFWVRRFARIFPAYWVMVTVALALGVLHTYSVDDWITYYGLLLNYRGGYVGLGVEWTLVVEVSFYVALPAVAWLLRVCTRPGASMRTKVRTQVIGLLILGAGSVAVRAWDLWAYEPTVSPGAWFPISQINLWLVSYFDWFAIGMLLAVVSARAAAGGPLPSVIGLLARRPWVSWLLAIGCFWVTTRLNFPLFGLRIVSPLQEFMRNAMSISAAAFLVLPAAFGEQGEGLIRRGLRTPVMVGLGVVSYGIYLWHAVWFGAIRKWTVQGDFRRGTVIAIGIVFVATLACAGASYFLVERPTRRWAQRITRSPLAHAAATRPADPAEHAGSASGAGLDSSTAGPMVDVAEVAPATTVDSTAYAVVAVVATAIVWLGIVMPSVV